MLASLLGAATLLSAATIDAQRGRAAERRADVRGPDDGWRRGGGDWDRGRWERDGRRRGRRDRGRQDFGRRDRFDRGWKGGSWDRSGRRGRGHGAAGARGRGGVAGVLGSVLGGRRGGWPGNGRRRGGRALHGGWPVLLGAVIGGRLLGADARRWLGDGRFRSRFERGGRGRPDVLTWFDERGRVHQRWIDRDGDGRADRVETYDRGRLRRTLDAEHR